jgi:hypothetical protein
MGEVGAGLRFRKTDRLLGKICKAGKRNPVECRDGFATVIGTKPRKPLVVRVI